MVARELRFLLSSIICTRKFCHCYELRRVAELKEKAIRDESNRMRHALKEGREEGRREAKEQIAKKMLSLNMRIEEIEEITGLTKEEVIELKEK